MLTENSEKKLTELLHELTTKNDILMKSTSTSSSSSTVDVYTFENEDENHTSTILQSMKTKYSSQF